MRGDFDSSGNGFYTTWDDHWDRWKTDEFKAELDEVINTLREGKGLLHNRRDMAAFARANPDAAFMGNYCTEYGFRVDTEKHAWLTLSVMTSFGRSGDKEGKIMKITISEIKVNPGRRPINLDGISELARSISEIGLLNPITIDQEHILVAGLHRLEAAKLLGWTEIECNVCSLDTLQTELAEIDENVVRTELSVIEYGELLERRKEIYESIHPETKAGQAQAAGMNRAIGNNVSDKMSATMRSFAQDTADKLGVSPRTVERTVQMMNGLTEDTREVFRHFPNYKLNQSNAMKLSRMEPGKQKTAAILLASGQIRSVDEYQPTEVRAAPGHAKSSRQQKVEFLESVAALKDPTKDCRQSPGDFVLEYSAFIEKVQRGVESFRLPNYEEALPALSQEQLHTLICLTDSCRKTLEDYLSFVKEVRANV